MSCPFCQPNVSNTTFAESENFRALYNLAPVLPGHVLIVPKQHLVSFLDIDELSSIELIVFSRKVTRVLLEVFNCTSFDWTIQDGKPAGQTIEHFHLHLILRYENDLPEPGDWYPAIIAKTSELVDSYSRLKITDSEMEIIIAKLKQYFKS